MAAKADQLVHQLRSDGVRIISDTRDIYTPGWKYNHWELKVRLQSSSSLVALALRGHLQLLAAFGFLWSFSSLAAFGSVWFSSSLTAFGILWSSSSLTALAVRGPLYHWQLMAPCGPLHHWQLFMFCEAVSD